jgi:hypothetical protein
MTKCQSWLWQPKHDSVVLQKEKGCPQKLWVEWLHFHFIERVTLSQSLIHPIKQMMKMSTRMAVAITRTIDDLMYQRCRQDSAT